MSSPRHVFRPLILLSSVCGTLPYTTNLKFSSLLLICCVFINSVPPIYMLYSAFQSLKAIHHIPANDTLLHVAKIISFLACMANLYFLFRCREKFLLILREFEDIHKFLKVSSAGLQKPRRHVQLIIYTICTSAWALTMLNIAVKPHKFNFSSLISLANYLTVATALQSLGTQFLSFSILILFYLKHTNCKIAQLQKLYLACNSNKIVSEKIDDLRAAHNKLCDNARLVNRVYGIYLLLPLIYISIHLQMDIFQIVRNIIDCVTGFPYDQLGGAEWLITIMWIISDINKLCTFFIVSYLVRLEVK